MFDRINRVNSAEDSDRWKRWERWSISILLRLEPTYTHPNYAQAAEALNTLATGARIFGRRRYTQNDWLYWGSAERNLRKEPPKSEPADADIQFNVRSPQVRELAYLSAKIMGPFNRGQYTQDDWMPWISLRAIVLQQEVKRYPSRSPQWEMLRDALMGRPQRSTRTRVPTPTLDGGFL
jgi:hypothetical protein